MKIIIIPNTNNNIGLDDSCWYLKAQPQHGPPKTRLFPILKFHFSRDHFNFDYNPQKSQFLASSIANSPVWKSLQQHCAAAQPLKCDQY